MNGMNENEHVSKMYELIRSVQKLVDIIPGSGLPKFQTTRIYITIGKQCIASLRVSGIQIGTVWR